MPEYPGDAQAAIATDTKDEKLSQGRRLPTAPLTPTVRTHRRGLTSASVRPQKSRLLPRD